jgi:hypothetical protein
MPFGRVTSHKDWMDYEGVYIGTNLFHLGWVLSLMVLTLKRERERERGRENRTKKTFAFVYNASLHLGKLDL